MTNKNFDAEMDIDMGPPKVEEEVDELEDDYFQDEDQPNKEEEDSIHDFALPEPTVRTLSTQTLHGMQNATWKIISTELSSGSPSRYDTRGRNRH